MTSSPWARRWWIVMVSALVACGGTPGPETDAGGADGGAQRCVDDTECSDHAFCNGAERCRPGLAGTDARGCIRAIDVTPCLANQVCDEMGDRCVTQCDATPDADGDGVTAIACGGNDCDDTRMDVHPGAAEVCDAHDVDEDCDPTTFGDRDVDGDGVVDARCCNGMGATRACGTDCDDARRDARPGADEVCNAHDDDCDGTTDEGVSSMGFVDADGDLSGDPARPVVACPGAGHFSITSDDCDDADPRRNPSQAEVCDGVDNDCDDTIDETARAVTWYVDADGDGFGARTGATLVACAPPAGYSLFPNDCDDTRPEVSPLGAEQCNALDDDCNGAADYLIAPGDFEDDDHDTFPDARCGTTVRDCNDEDPFSYPGGDEICDLRDNDCDDTIDETTSMRDWLPDADGDLWGANGATATSSCAPVAGHVLRGGDCDDANGTVHPATIDACGAGALRDDDCDMQIDEDGNVASYTDADADGYGTGMVAFACSVPAGRAAAPGDCDDGDPARSPGVAEICTSGVDEDCDLAIDCADHDCAAATVCTASRIELVSAPMPAAAPPLGPLPADVRVRVLDVHGAPVGGAVVTIAGTNGAFAQTPTATTSASGEVSTVLYVGPSAGPCRFTFSSPGAMPLLLDATATAVASGAVETIVGQAGNPVTSLPVAAASVALTMGGGAFLEDGTVAVSALGCVMRIDATGMLTAFVGQCRFSGGVGASGGDGGAALDATFASTGLVALDRIGHRLFVSDPLAGRVRVVDLLGGTIAAFATGVPTPVDLDAGPDGAVYVTSGGSVVRYDATGHTTFAASASSRTDASTTLLEPIASLAFATNGSALLVDSQDYAGTTYPAIGARVGPLATDLPMDTGLSVSAGSPGLVVASADTHHVYYASDGALHRTTAVEFVDTALPVGVIAHPLAVDVRGGDVLLVGANHVARLIGVDQPTPAYAYTPSPLTATVAPGAQQDITFDCATCCDPTRGEDGWPYAVGAHAVDPGGAFLRAAANCGYPSTLSILAGWLPGSYHFDIGLTAPTGELLQTQAIDLTVAMPASGTATRLSPSLPWVFGGSSSSFLHVRGLAPTSDGGLYLGAPSSFNAPDPGSHVLWSGVLHADAHGAAMRVAGAQWSDRPDGDGGPAVAASFADGAVSSIALDAAHARLFVADALASGDPVVRAIDTATSTISAYAGGGASSADGALRDALHIDAPISQLRVSPHDGSLWIATTASIRTIDATTGTVATPVALDASCNSAPSLASCGMGCDVAFAADGTAYVAGSVCVPGCAAPVPGVLRVPIAGAASLLLGSCTDPSTTGAAPSATSVSEVRALVMQSDGSLVVAAGLGAGPSLIDVPVSGGVVSAILSPLPSADVAELALLAGGGVVYAGDDGSLWRVW